MNKTEEERRKVLQDIGDDQRRRAKRSGVAGVAGLTIDFATRWRCSLLSASPRMEADPRDYSGPPISAEAVAWWYADALRVPHAEWEARIRCDAGPDQTYDVSIECLRSGERITHVSR